MIFFLGKQRKAWSLAAVHDFGLKIQVITHSLCENYKSTNHLLINNQPSIVFIKWSNVCTYYGPMCVLWSNVCENYKSTNHLLINNSFFIAQMFTYYGPMCVCIYSKTRWKWTQRQKHYIDGEKSNLISFAP